jgi:ribosomal protein L11 methyltransferase
MKRQTLWRVAVITAAEAEDAVAELVGTVFRQPASIYYDLETGRSAVTVYLQRRFFFTDEMDKALHTGLERINKCGLKTGPGKVTVTKMRQADWAESWKRHFQPMVIGETLLIQPSWSRRRPRRNQASVILDPGLSFGTGRHPTTAFCLRALTRCRKAGAKQSFLDMGTGSGILAIAAAKLGYSPVHAFDHDPEAVRVARANARKNRVHRMIRIDRRDVKTLPLRPVRQYDLICANLISTLLITECQRIVAQLRRGGTLVLAGILKTEFPQIRKVYTPLGLKLAVRKSENEWCSGSFRFAEGNFGKI